MSVDSKPEKRKTLTLVRGIRTAVSKKKNRFQQVECRVQPTVALSAVIPRTRHSFGSVCGYRCYRRVTVVQSVALPMPFATAPNVLTRCLTS